MNIEINGSGLYVRNIGRLSQPLNLTGPHTFSYRYPLLSEARRVHVLSNPTALDLLMLAASDYASIYRAKVPRTWGHDLGDLVFEEVYVDEEKAIVSFQIGS
jgi:hypothetical protein